MGCHRVKNSAIELFWRSVLPVVMFGMLMVLAPGTLGQRLAGNRSTGFSGGHVGGFSGGGLYGAFRAPHPFGGFTAPAPRGFGAAPRMNWVAPRYNFVPQRNDYALTPPV